jgi:hypothetical protein
VASPTPTDCSAFGVSGDTLFIAEKPDAALRYPDGSGLAIGADQLIGLEIHFINYFADEDIEIEGTVTLDLAPPDAQLREVGLIFTGDLGLFLPPLETTTVQSFHTVPPGAEIFAVTSHTHQLGTYAAIHRARGVDDPDAELLHEALLWSEPPLDVFDPPLVLAADEGLALTCEYFNTTEQAVTFGTGFFDEMCFLWAHYVMP